MKTIGLFEAKNRFSEVCDTVSRGEPILVTKRGKPLVRILPVSAPVSSDIWSTVKEGRSKYGALDEGLDLPARDTTKNRKSPL